VGLRDDAWVACLWYCQPLVNGVYRLAEGAFLDDFWHFLQAIGVMALLEAHGAAIRRTVLLFVQYVLRYGVKILFGIERMTDSGGPTPDRPPCVAGVPHGTPTDPARRQST
jgi:hypothetical protein